MRIDRVDPERDEREREDGRQQRPGPVPAQQPSHDPVRDGGGEAAENRRVRDLDDVVRTERLDERRLGKELERRQDQRELRVGNVAEGDPRRGNQRIRDVHEDGDLAVPPDNERRARQKQDGWCEELLARRRGAGAQHRTRV